MWESQECTVSRLKRVRYGDIFLDKKLPRGGWMELDLKEVNYLRELVELRPEKETMLDLNKDNTSRKRERARSQKIRRAVKRHEERVNTPKGRSNNPSRRKPKKTAGDQGARNKHR